MTTIGAFELPTVLLSVRAAERTLEMARRLCAAEAVRVDDPRWVASVRKASADLSGEVRQAVRSFRRYPGRCGAVLIRQFGLGTDSLPDTPSVAESAQRQGSVAAATLLMISCELGDPIGFRAEKSGALVHDVVPVKGMETFQGNAGSVKLSWHNENAFHAFRPDYLVLLCLRQDHDGAAGLRIVGIAETLPHLSLKARAALFKADFRTEPPASFEIATASAGMKSHAVLAGPPENPDVRVDLHSTKPLNQAAGSALAELAEACDSLAHAIVLRPGDVAIMDNRICLHGRTEFVPRYDGRDRWLQRTYVSADLRRSRCHRIDDGYVVH